MLTLTGTLLAGKYRVGARLGGGGMGEVYEGIQEDLGRRVAIKVMSGPMANDPQLLARFQLEAKAVAALGHPHIVSVTDFQDNPNEPPFIVMERLVGESLGELLEREPMVEPGRACRIAEQTLSALAAAHEAGLVHRDVKPDNIFLCRTDVSSHPASGAPNAEIVKLLDFGVAKALEAQAGGKLTSTGAIVGTLVYMAPEQARGESIDARADVYALGACLYHMLAGQPPFPAVNAARLLSAVCNESPMPLGALRPDVDGNIIAIIARAMARDANHRFISARAMMGAIGAFMRGEAPLTDPMSVTALATPAFGYAPQSPRVTGAPQPFSGAGMPPSTGPRHTPHPMSPYAHPGSGGGVVVPPYAVGPSIPPPRRSGAVVALVSLMVLLAGSALAGAGFIYMKSKRTTVVTQTQTAPPPVSLVAATAQGEDTLTTLAPTGTASSVAHVNVPIGTSAINPPPNTTATTAATSNVSLNGMTYAQLAGQMSKAFQAGDGRTCLDAFDKMKGMPEYDPSTYAMIRGDCLMEAGRCDEGRRVVRDYYNQPKANVMLQMTQQQIDSSVSSIAQMYCPPSQLNPSERAQRAQILLSRAGSDHTQAAHYADEMATLIPQLPRGTQEERQKIIGYEYQIGKAYGDAGRCNDAQTHFHEECSLSSPQHADACAKGLLNNTSGCKSSP